MLSPISAFRSPPVPFTFGAESHPSSYTPGPRSTAEQSSGNQDRTAWALTAMGREGGRPSSSSTAEASASARALTDLVESRSLRGVGGGTEVRGWQRESRSCCLQDHERHTVIRHAAWLGLLISDLSTLA